MAVQSWSEFAAETAAQAPAVPAPGYADAGAMVAAGQAAAFESAPWNQPLYAGLEEIEGLPFCDSTDRVLQLDLFRPAAASADEPLPVILFVHGGGWHEQTRKDIRHFAMALAQAGFLTASAEYRLSGEAPYPAAVVDVRSALRWLRGYAGEYGGDGARMGVMGTSAGAHLALLTAYSDENLFARSGCDSREVGAIKAVAALYPPTDFTVQPMTDLDAVSRFMGGTFAERPEAYREASPLYHVGADTPPTLLMHGSSDQIVPVTQSDRLAERLSEFKVPCLYDRVPDWPHGMDFSVAVRDRCVYFMTAFFRRTLQQTGIEGVE